MPRQFRLLAALGGFYAYDGGGYAESALGELLPVEQEIGTVGPNWLSPGRSTRKISLDC